MSGGAGPGFHCPVRLETDPILTRRWARSRYLRCCTLVHGQVTHVSVVKTCLSRASSRAPTISTSCDSQKAMATSWQRRLRVHDHKREPLSRQGFYQDGRVGTRAGFAAAQTERPNSLSRSVCTSRPRRRDAVGSATDRTPRSSGSATMESKTAVDTLATSRRHNLQPITTSAADPESNGMAESFVNTIRRDYLAGADLVTATVVLEQRPCGSPSIMNAAQRNRRSATAPHTSIARRCCSSPRSSSPSCPTNSDSQQHHRCLSRAFPSCVTSPYTAARA